ncbi:alanyl-tRNA editing protein [Halalkalicoccus ordinarius]|uniref:alanyl-tRNA editing protein n=1 Tax=Halalkalicoccus ordinarius TaxID=3116651 RepID=UPI00300F4090
MTLTRAPAEPYVREFEATVERIDGRELVLDRSYFYPESGGQPADKGEISGIGISDVRAHDGETIHVLEEESDLEAGDRVDCAVDPAFRTYCMRAHTASHVLYGAGRRLLDDLGYGGFDIGEEKVRIDFETSTEIDDDVLVELERLTNRTVWESRAVSWETVPAEEATSREEVAFNTKTEEGVFGDGEGVRIVTVGEADAGDPIGPSEGTWDVAACGGTHVSNTREIGPVSVLERSNPGEGLTRVELAVGPAAIEHRTATRTAALSAARELGIGVADLPAAVERRNDRIEELEDERDALLDRVVDARIEALREEVVERAGERWLVGSVPDADGDTLSDRARRLAGEEYEVVALVSDERPPTVAVASESGTDAGAIVDDLTDEFGGGGGGGHEFAQGGGIGEEPERIVEFLRN